MTIFYQQIANILAQQKHNLGMSEAYIAECSGVSQPTVHRILSGKHDKAAWNDIAAIAEVLGIEIEEMSFKIKPASEMLDQQAEMLAKAMTRVTQATSQLEGQGFSDRKQEDLIKDTKIRLLAGSRRKLWMEK